MSAEALATRSGAARALRDDPEFVAFALGALALVAVRILALAVSPARLGPDEAQYWLWSRSFEWGYFSKPPLVAWTIAATTALFGDQPWAVKLAAPVLHLFAALPLFFLGRRLYGAGAGFLCGFGWLLVPGVFLSSAIISTDCLLLPLWAGALYASWRWIETGRAGWALATGAAIGVGMLAKYAMLYFIVSAVVAAVLSAPARRAFASWRGLLAVAVAGAILAPNLLWNAAHGFETVKHTAANANWGGSLFHVDQFAAFVIDQVGILFPASIAFGWALYEIARGKTAFDDRARFLVAFAATPLLIVCAQALISRAHANWAAVAYPSLLVFVVGRFLGTGWPRRALWGNAAFFAVFLALTTFPIVIDTLDLKLKNVRLALAWDKTAAQIESEARKSGPYTAVLVDDRDTFFELSYEWRDKTGLPPLRMWVLRDAPGSHPEAAAPMGAAYGGRVLVAVAQKHYEKILAADFARYREIGGVVTPLGGTRTRALTLSEASGFQPAPRTKEFLARVGD